MSNIHSHLQLSDAITEWWLGHDLFDPCCIFSNPAIFIESYAIRGALQRVRQMQTRGLWDANTGESTSVAPSISMDGTLEDAMVRCDVKTTHDGERLLAGAYAFCNRVVAHQGVQGPADALMMGYGLRVHNGMIEHACVADQAAIASAVVDTITLRPQHPQAATWQDAIERWVNWVLANFLQPNGGIGVGILAHQWNPIPEYWCATSLTTSVLFRLACITGNPTYAQAGLASLQWLADFDHTTVDIPRFTECAPEVVLYASEGIVEGIRHLVDTQGVDAARQHPAAKHFAEMAQWLVDNQATNGRWPEPVERGYRDYSNGIPWLLLEMDTLIGPEPSWQACAKRFLDNLAIPEETHYYGLFVRPFTTGLAWLSSVTAAIAADKAGDSQGF